MAERGTNLPNNVRDAMRENLSGQVGVLLREELARGENAVEELVDANQYIAKLEDELKEHGTIARAKSDLTKLQKQIETGTKLLDDKINGHELFKAQTLLDAEQYINKKLAETLRNVTTAGKANAT